MKCLIDDMECQRAISCDACPRSPPTGIVNCSPPPAADQNDPADQDTSRPLTLLERACLDLRLPESNTPWLDKLIAKKRLEDVAVRIAAGYRSVCDHSDDSAKILAANAFDDAAALIERCNQK